MLIQTDLTVIAIFYISEEKFFFLIHRYVVLTLKSQKKKLNDQQDSLVITNAKTIRTIECNPSKNIFNFYRYEK